MRDALNRMPWLRVLVLLALLLGVVYAYLRVSGGDDLRSVKNLSEEMVIRDAETGDEWSVVRGNLEMELIRRSAAETLGPTVGLTNPKTGKPNGFPIDGSWAETINRISSARAEAAGTGPAVHEK